MFLTEEEIQSRLNSPDNLINIIKEDKLNPTVKVVKWQGFNEGSKPVGTRNLTEEERTAAGVLARTMGNTIASEVIGIKEHTASNINHGNSSVTPEQVALVDKAMGLVSKEVESKAAERLLSALGFLDDDKLAKSNAKDLSVIAANMSRTVANMKPRDNNHGSSGMKVQVVLHQNKPLKEEHFEIIEVSA